jgi:hypothetical protein
MPEHLGKTVHQFAGGERFADGRGHPGVHRPGIVKIVETTLSRRLSAVGVVLESMARIDAVGLLTVCAGDEGRGDVTQFAVGVL